MKKIQSILVIALGVCAMLTSCQELDTPINNRNGRGNRDYSNQRPSFIQIRKWKS